ALAIRYRSTAAAHDAITQLPREVSLHCERLTRLSAISTRVSTPSWEKDHEQRTAAHSRAAAEMVAARSGVSRGVSRRSARGVCLKARHAEAARVVHVRGAPARGSFLRPEASQHTKPSQGANIRVQFAS